MRVFKPKRRGARGGRHEYSRWYCSFRDHRRKIRKLACFTDRSATDEFGRKLERLVARRTAGQHLEPELAEWIERLPDSMRTKLGNIGLLDPAQVAAHGALLDLVSQFEASLTASSATEKHVSLTLGRIRRTLDSCGFRVWSDLDGLVLERHLKGRRESGISAKTSNDTLAAMKQLTKWALVRGLATRDPLLAVKPVNAKANRTRERRSLTRDDELPRLIRAAARGPIYRGMSGPLRALVYKMAAETGLRVGELQSLRVGDFDLRSADPSVVLQAGAEKSRRGAVIPLLRTTADELAPYLRAKHPAAKALPLPKSFKDKATRWLGFDLEAAGIPYKDEMGRVADFHSLRTSFVSHLMSGRVNPKVVQSLARHASPDMTLSHYTKLGRDDERRALEELSPLPSIGDADQCESATGTESVASSVALQGGLDDASRDQYGQASGPGAFENADRGRELVEAAGIEPASPLPRDSAQVMNVKAVARRRQHRRQMCPASCPARRSSSAQLRKNFMSWCENGPDYRQRPKRPF